VFDVVWRGVLLGVVVLLDAIVFADLVGAELREMRANRRSPSLPNFGRSAKLGLGWRRRRHGAVHSL
jgi:hypothetical protein